MSSDDLARHPYIQLGNEKRKPEGFLFKGTVLTVRLSEVLLCRHIVPNKFKHKQHNQELKYQP
ncbi:hypothetical protein [Neisseria sp.]|uniref:hypothetical protein n=1 Tax=Neisseria sp. TaxID=192066 RepID=UPI0035A12987